eukprot:579023-Pyramimonas_sp.AAC.1
MGRLPAPGCAEDAAKLISLVKVANAASKEPLEEIEDSLVTMLAYGASGELRCVALSVLRARHAETLS